MKVLPFILLIFYCFSLTAENPCDLMRARASDGNWGEGGVYIPQNAAIKIYTVVLEEVGVIYRANNRMFLKYLTAVEEQISFTNDVEYIRHYNYLFVRAATYGKGDYLRVLLNKKNSNHFKFLVKRDELFDIGGDYCTYQELLLEDNLPLELEGAKSMANVGINLTDICLNLRKSPSIKAHRINCFGVNGPPGLTKLSYLSSEGKWMKVKVSLCRLNDVDNSDMDEGGCGGCCCKVKETEYVGWMKAISEDGSPNIWFSVNSY